MISKLNVLIVEDGKSDFLFLKKHLENIKDWEMTVYSAETFPEAKKMLASVQLDICFLDYHIHNENAEDFLVEIQLISEYIPIILVSASEARELREIAIKAKVDDYISKQDITSVLLIRIIRYCVSSNKSRANAKVQEQKYLNLFNNSLEAIFTADKNFNIIRANQSFKELMKTELTEGFDFRKLFGAENYDQFVSALSDGQARNIKRTKIINANGDVLEVYVAISRIFNESEKAAYQIVIHDITDFELIQTKLHESEKTSLIERMARIIGHEVRNPLTNIMLATEEMKDDFADNEDAKLMLEMIHRNSIRISSLIDNFLKNTTGSAIVKANVILEELVKEAFKNCEDRVKLKQIKYKLSGLDGSTQVFIDAEKIKIVITNIIINAAEALENVTNPTLSISVLNEANQPTIVIEDNGAGMTDQVKENLFQPFFSSKQGGLGLGMANSKKILDEHEASINVQSEVGQGTKFEITFNFE